MNRYVFVILAGIGVAHAGTYDYFECTDKFGHVSQSVEPCGRGEKQRRIQDDALPMTMELGRDTTVRLSGFSGGHFYATVVINGVPARAMVDTGATLLSVSPQFATRAGLDRLPSRQHLTQTANGTGTAKYVVAHTVELGGNTLRDVGVSINGKDFGPREDALLGMSVLKHFEITVDGGSMTLRRK